MRQTTWSVCLRAAQLRTQSFASHFQFCAAIESCYYFDYLLFFYYYYYYYFNAVLFMACQSIFRIPTPVLLSITPHLVSGSHSRAAASKRRTKNSQPAKKKSASSRRPPSPPPRTAVAKISCSVQFQAVLYITSAYSADGLLCGICHHDRSVTAGSWEPVLQASSPSAAQLINFFFCCVSWTGGGITDRRLTNRL